MKLKPFSIELSEEAITDFDNSYHFYYKDNPKIADDFFLAINRGFNSIKQNPTTFPFIHKKVRKYVVKKFPFVIYYRVIDSIIQIIAIFHTNRNPEIWNDRL